MNDLKVLARTDAPERVGRALDAEGIWLTAVIGTRDSVTRAYDRQPVDIVLLDGHGLTSAEAAALGALIAPPRLAVCGAGEPCDARAVSPADEPAYLSCVRRAAEPAAGVLAAPSYPAREQMAGTALARMGMAASLKGFTLLARAAAWISAFPPLQYQLMKSVYPVLGTTHTAERNMRHALERLFLNGRLPEIERMFGASVDPARGKPTNAEALAVLAEYIRSEYGRQSNSSQ